jgi:RNA polymerase sigma-70 factor (ECF subfamily)
MSDAGQPKGSVEQLILRETPKAYHLAMGFTRNSEDSKELVQEASYRILLRRQDYDAAKCGAAWFKAVVRNLFIDSRRSVEHRHGVPLNQLVGDEGLSYVDTLPSEEPGVLERLEREEDRQTVRRISRKLNKELLAVLKLIDMEGLDYKQAAQVLSIPTGTVRSRLSRARQSFRLLWAKENLVHG